MGTFTPEWLRKFHDLSTPEKQEVLTALPSEQQDALVDAYRGWRAEQEKPAPGLLDALRQRVSSASKVLHKNLMGVGDTVTPEEMADVVSGSPVYGVLPLAAGFLPGGMFRSRAEQVSVPRMLAADMLFSGDPVAQTVASLNRMNSTSVDPTTAEDVFGRGDPRVQQAALRLEESLTNARGEGPLGLTPAQAAGVVRGLTTLVPTAVQSVVPSVGIGKLAADALPKTAGYLPRIAAAIGADAAANIAQAAGLAGALGGTQAAVETAKGMITDPKQLALMSAGGVLGGIASRRGVMRPASVIKAQGGKVELEPATSTAVIDRGPVTQVADFNEPTVQITAPEGLTEPGGPGSRILGFEGGVAPAGELPVVLDPTVRRAAPAPAPAPASASFEFTPDDVLPGRGGRNWAVSTPEQMDAVAEAFAAARNTQIADPAELMRRMIAHEAANRPAPAIVDYEAQQRRLQERLAAGAPGAAPRPAPVRSFMDEILDESSSPSQKAPQNNDVSAQLDELLGIKPAGRDSPAGKYDIGAEGAQKNVAQKAVLGNDNPAVQMVNPDVDIGQRALTTERAPRNKFEPVRVVRPDGTVQVLRLMWRKGASKGSKWTLQAPAGLPEGGAFFPVKIAGKAGQRPIRYEFRYDLEASPERRALPPGAPQPPPSGGTPPDAGGGNTRVDRVPNERTVPGRRLAAQREPLPEQAQAVSNPRSPEGAGEVDLPLGAAAASPEDRLLPPAFRLPPTPTSPPAYVVTVRTPEGTSPGRLNWKTGELHWMEGDQLKSVTLFDNTGDWNLRFTDHGVEAMVGLGGGNTGGGGRKGGPPVDDLTRPPELHSQNPMFDAAAQAKKLVYEDNASFSAMLRELRHRWALPENYAARDLYPFVVSAKASRQLGKAAFEHVYNTLAAAYKQLSPGDKQAWMDWVRRAQNREKVSATEAPAPVRALTEKIVAQNERMVDVLVREGFLTPEEGQLYADRARDLGAWMPLDYAVFLGKSKFKGADVGAYREALDYLMNKNLARTEGEAVAKVREMMDRFYNKRSQREGLIGSKLRGPSDAQQLADAAAAVLRVRSLPPAFREVLGRITDPRYILAKSVAELEGMYAQLNWTKAYTEAFPDGTGWASPATYNQMNTAQKAKFHPQPLWIDGLDAAENRKTFGKLAGAYVPKDVWEAMQVAQPSRINNFVLNIASYFQNWFRLSKTVFSTFGAIRNLLGNAQYSAAAGLAPWDPRFYAKWKEAFSIHREYWRMPTLADARANPKAQRLVWAMEDGGLQPGRGADMASDQNKMAALRAVEEAKDYGSAINKLWLAMNNGRITLGQYYELMDSIPRLAVYNFQLERGLKSGMDLGAARRRAGSIVHRYFASSANIGPALRQLANLPFFGPFMGWTVDNFRVFKNSLTDAGRAAAALVTGKGRMADLNPASGEGLAPFVNQMLYRALFLTGLKAVVQYTQGTTDAEAEAADKSARAFFREGNPMRLVFKVKDQPYVVSLDAIDPVGSVLMSGSEEAALPSKVFANYLRAYYADGVLEPWADQRLAGVGLPVPKNFSPEVMPGGELDNALDATWQYLAPAALTTFQSAMRRTGLSDEPLRPGEEPFSMYEGVAYGVSPFRFEKVGPRTQESERLRLERDANAAASLPAKIGRKKAIGPGIKAPGTDSSSERREKYELRARDEVFRQRDRQMR